jgi:dTDP-4-dehydrorhamnose reductase
MPTLIIGSGFIGSALAAAVPDAVVASRNPPGLSTPWVELDVTDPAACRRAITHSGCDSVVLVHGPSDVTWCEHHTERARRGHETAAHNIADIAGGRRIVMISTDNVFDGTEPRPAENAPTRPANAYGVAKLAAEQEISRAANTAILRVSLIYGWEPPDSTKWLNFFASCVHRLRAGESVTVPYDQWTTPVLREDVVAITHALVRAREVPPLLHLGGPERISRAAWATIIADRLDVAPDLVVAAPKSAGRYASRPTNSCLASTLIADHPATKDIPIRGAREGATVLLDRVVPV